MEGLTVKKTPTDETPSQFTYETLKPKLNGLLQTGSILEVGENGHQIDDMVRFCRDKIAEFNARAFHPQNLMAMDGLHAALIALNNRTQERSARGVEGTENE